MEVPGHDPKSHVLRGRGLGAQLAEAQRPVVLLNWWGLESQRGFSVLRGGGGGYRQSAYASIPCYLCVAFALTVSKVLT
jgi:hypothetical protein